MSQQWFCARTMLAKETFALSALQSADLVVYLPLYVSHWEKTRAASRGIEPKVRPFLPGYLFFRSDLEDENAKWRAVFSSPGIHTVLCTPQGKPEAIPDWVIEDMQAREVNGIIQLPPPQMSSRKWRQLNARFKEGDRVHVQGSPIEAIFHEMADLQRAVVFVQMLGKLHRKDVMLSRLTKGAGAASG